VGLQKRSFHQLPIGAPGPLILGCVSWFFESVVGQILDSGCRLKMVVGFKFYLSGCTSYPGCLQLVILFVILCYEDRDSIHIIWYSELEVLGSGCSVDLIEDEEDALWI
jgi:hypothetical protein